MHFASFGELLVFQGLHHLILGHYTNRNPSWFSLTFLKEQHHRVDVCDLPNSMKWKLERCWWYNDLFRIFLMYVIINY